MFEFLVATLLTLITYIAYILVFAFMMWMAVDAAKQDRFWWIVLILGIPAIGAAVYFFTEKKRVYAEAPSHHIHTSETEQQHEHSHHKHHEHKSEEKKEKKDDEIRLATESTEEKKEENSKEKA